MAPVLHLVRHAQGFHNLSTANHSIHDPLVTPYGKQQCQYLSKTFPYASTVELVVASPLKRTIYTALLSFPDIISKRQTAVLALPEVQETSDLPCDTGSERDELQKEFSGHPIDLSLVKDGWNSKKNQWAPNTAAIEERCRVARRWLRDRPEKDIVVVTHGGLLHYLTEDWAGLDRKQGTGWANTEFRSYTFDLASGDDAAIVETEESRTRRRGIEKLPTEAEQRNIKRVAATDASQNQATNAVKVSSKV
ncbi:MAG: hypothetical protein M1831_000754 [Alyxoria varia]|nr:MAG: hypothetical protein M1831_000754 [Alyxoria varia]